MDGRIVSVLIVMMLCMPAFAAVDAHAIGDLCTDVCTEEDDGEHDDGTVLVKSSCFRESMLNVPHRSAERIFPGSHWYLVELGSGCDAESAYDALQASGRFEDVSLNHIYGTETAGSVDISQNMLSDSSVYLDSMRIKQAWDDLVGMGVSPGGDRNVIVAVIDTGVDYGHEDLKGNIWRNTDEIPDNGIDDDGNGYIDDVIGWNFVSDSSDPMDDQGHGTHVAGIIGAENNTVGTVGVAFNCQVMCLKAGDANGSFNSARISAAIYYAAENGAQVINMSIGGSSKDGPIADAVEDTQDRCICVAAAANSSRCNNSAHGSLHDSAPSYPGAFPGTIGVMSATKDGHDQSWFSNYDHTPYDDVEYDTYGAGSEILSTWPHDRYATLNGTSMATPVVAGITALVLSSEPDRERLTLNEVRAAVVNAGSIHPYNAILGEESVYTFCDAMDALHPDEVPFAAPMSPHVLEKDTLKPIDASMSMVDAGTSMVIGADVHNRGFSAGSVSMTLTSADPYIAIEEREWNYGPIDTYGTVPWVPEGEGRIGGFDAAISPDCPHGHPIECGMTVSWTDADSGASGSWTREFVLKVQNETVLPSEISGDTVFDSSHRYIVQGSVRIASGAHVSFTEGCEVFLESGAGIATDGSLSFTGSSVSAHSGSSCVIERTSRDARLDLTDCALDSVALHAGADPVGNMSLTGCTIDAESVNSSCMDLVGLRDTVFTGSCTEMNVKGAERSLITVTDTAQLTFSGPAVKDCVLILDVYDFQYVDAEFLCDAENLLIADDRNGDLGDCTFCADDGVTLKDVCFEASLKGCGDLPSVPFSDMDASVLWPMVLSAQVLEENGSVPENIMNDVYTLRLEMSRPMDASASVEASWYDPASRNSGNIAGDYVSDTVWEGKLDLSKRNEPMEFDLRIGGGSDASGTGKGIVPSCDHYVFSMSTKHEVDLWAEPCIDGLGTELWFIYPDYMSTMGFNVYRSDSCDGELIRLNEFPVSPEFIVYEDRTAVPGETYWYTMTWVDLDLNESEPQERVRFTVPVIEHLPFEKVFRGTDVTVRCTVRGDMDVTGAVLTYRCEGSWKQVPMDLMSGTYSASVPSGDISGDELEYFISVSDGTPGEHPELVHTVTFGDRNRPVTAEVQERDDVLTASAAVLLVLMSSALVLLFRRN